MRIYEVPADLPDRHDAVITWVRANLDNIKLSVNMLAGCFGDCDDPGFLYKAIHDSCTQIEEQLSRANKLITTAMFGDESAATAT